MSGAVGAVVDLVSTTGSWRTDGRVWRTANRGKYGEFADFHGEVVVGGGVAEGAGHAAATGGEDLDVGEKAFEEVGTGGVAPKGFLVAVAVENDRTVAFCDAR